MPSQVGKEGEVQPLPLRSLHPAGNINLGDRELHAHDPYALIKCCESLTFLVRDVAHITPYNFEYCVHCIRTFVEASLHSSKFSHLLNNGIIQSQHYFLFKLFKL